MNKISKEEWDKVEKLTRDVRTAIKLTSKLLKEKSSNALNGELKYAGASHIFRRSVFIYEQILAICDNGEREKKRILLDLLESVRDPLGEIEKMLADMYYYSDEVIVVRVRLGNAKDDIGHFIDNCKR